MGLFRREPLHRRLAREGGLLPAGAPVDTTPRWGEAGIHGVARPRRWDAVVVVDAPGPAADQVEFTVLPDGTLLVDDDADGGALQPLAEGIEASLRPPYRAEAVRRGPERWAVAGRTIEVAELPEDVEGDELELTVSDGDRSLTVDGMHAFGSVPELERVGGARYESYTVHAERLDGRLFEVRVNPL